MSNIDSLEPYHLVASLSIVIPSILLSVFVYYHILKSREYNKSRYLWLYTIRALNEGILYFTHLVCLHLPIQNFMFPILQEIKHSFTFPIVGFILIVSLYATFLFGIFLSLNRFLAIARISLFRKYLIWNPYLMEYKGSSGPIFLFLTPDMNGWENIYQYCIILYYLSNSTAEFVINGATLYEIMSRKDFCGSAAKRRVELGLYITTLCSFALSLLFTVAQVCIQFFSFTTASMYAMWGQQIVVDVMAMSGVYFLLAFSPSLRRHVFGAPRISGVEPCNKITASAK